ncbi:MAG TPA: DHA2 family efflux MFS transporter permease subunit, partial [Kofleriaceae bacterium]
VLFSRFPERQHGMAGALFGLGAITGPLLGPTIGGYLVDAASWHWIFFVNIPLGIAAAMIAWTQIEQPKFVPDRAPVDKAGIGLLAIGMVSLQYVLEEGNRNNWFEDRTITVLAVVAVISLVGFVSHELETPHPVVDLRVFSNRAYTAATILNFLVGTSVFAGSLLLSLYCGSIMHYRALEIGHVFLRANWIQFIIFPLVGKLVMKVDPRGLLLVANIGIFTSLWMNAHLTADANPQTLSLPLFIRSVGTGFGFVPLTLLGVASLPPARRAAGTALFNLTRELGASIGAATMSTLLDRNSKHAYSAITSHVDIYGSNLAGQISILEHGPGTRVFDPHLAALQVVHSRIEAQALLSAFNQCFLILAGCFLFASWVVVFMKRPGPAMKPPDAH